MHDWKKSITLHLKEQIFDDEYHQQIQCKKCVGFHVNSYRRIRFDDTKRLNAFIFKVTLKQVKIQTMNGNEKKCIDLH